MSYNDFLYDLIYNLWSTVHRIHSNRFHYNPFIYLFIGEHLSLKALFALFLRLERERALTAVLRYAENVVLFYWLMIIAYLLRLIFIDISVFFLWFRLNKIMLFYWIIFACFNSCHLTAKTVTTKLWSRDCMCNRLKNALETHHKSNHFSMKTSRNQTKTNSKSKKRFSCGRRKEEEVEPNKITKWANICLI